MVVDLHLAAAATLPPQCSSRVNNRVHPENGLGVHPVPRRSTLVTLNTSEDRCAGRRDIGDVAGLPQGIEDLSLHPRSEHQDQLGRKWHLHTRESYPLPFHVTDLSQC